MCLTPIRRLIHSTLFFIVFINFKPKFAFQHFKMLAPLLRVNQLRKHVNICMYFGSWAHIFSYKHSLSNVVMTKSGSDSPFCWMNLIFLKKIRGIIYHIHNSYLYEALTMWCVHQGTNVCLGITKQNVKLRLIWQI